MSVVHIDYFNFFYYYRLTTHVFVSRTGDSVRNKEIFIDYQFKRLNFRVF